MSEPTPQTEAGRQAVRDWPYIDAIEASVLAIEAEATQAGYLAGWNAANTARDLLEKAEE